MQNGDEGLPSIILAGQCILVKMFYRVLYRLETAQTVEMRTSLRRRAQYWRTNVVLPFFRLQELIYYVLIICFCFETRGVRSPCLEFIDS